MLTFLNQRFVRNALKLFERQYWLWWHSDIRRGKRLLGFCLVFEKESGSFVGEAGLFHLLFDDAQPEIELGYHLHKKF